MDAKNTQEFIKIYYKQYKHLEKYYPKQMEVMMLGSLQRGQRAVDIEKKYERLIRFKQDSHIWVYDDDTDSLSWCNPELFRIVKKGKTKSEIESTKKLDFEIGDVKWYGIILEGDGALTNYGISSLANKMVEGFTTVFDDKRSRDDYFDWLRK